MFQDGQKLTDERVERRLRDFTLVITASIVIVLNIDTLSIAEALLQRGGAGANALDRLPFGWKAADGLGDARGLRANVENFTRSRLPGLSPTDRFL